MWPVGPAGPPGEQLAEARAGPSGGVRSARSLLAVDEGKRLRQQLQQLLLRPLPGRPEAALEGAGAFALLAATIFAGSSFRASCRWASLRSIVFGFGRAFASGLQVVFLPTVTGTLPPCALLFRGLGGPRGSSSGRVASGRRDAATTAPVSATAMTNRIARFNASANFRMRKPFQPVSASGATARAHLDPLAAEGHALGDQPPFLSAALGERAVGADDPPPGQVGLVALEEDGARRSAARRRHVAVGADEALGDRPHALQHFELAVTQAPGPKASMMRFWYSLSSSGEMK